MKKDKQAIEDGLAVLFSKEDYRPLHERDLAKALKLPFGSRGVLRAALREMEAKGAASPAGHGRWAGPRAGSGGNCGKGEIAGTFVCRYNGTKVFAPDDASLGTMPVEDESALPAIHGDRVAAVPLRRGGRRMFGDGEGKGRDGAAAVRLVRILERRRKTVVGTLRVGEHYAYVVPRDVRIGSNVRLEGAPAGFRKREGHLVAASLLPPVQGEGLAAKFSRDLGDPESAANDIPALLLDHDRSESFGRDVLRSAAEGAAKPEADAGRVDLRGRLVVTIDPADAHDYDDAISIEPLPGGRTRLGVHIADVAAYVAPGSAVDLEARRRGCSAYLVDRVIRMLPEELTVATCSLQPREDHLAHTVDLVYDAKANLLEAKTFRSVIRSRAQLTYDGVQAFLDSGDRRGLPDGVPEALEALDALTRRLRAQRFRHGALDFVLPEVHCIVGPDGEPLRFEKQGGTPAYHLVEECMLAANKAVAELLAAAGVPFVSRVHDEPDEEQWASMGAELQALGVETPPSTPAEINAIARKARGKPKEHILTLAVLRNLNRAVYLAESRPHFGLGFRRYAHFTSPIRRYPDLLVHRILSAHERGEKPFYPKAALAALAQESSQAERDAAEMEAESVRVKRVRYYANLLAKGERGPWEGIVTGLNPKGLIVELTETLQSGMLSYASLENGYYVLSPDGFSASAGRGSRYRLGDRVMVELAEVDERLGRVDWRPPAQSRAAGTEGRARRFRSRRASR
jgi:ribonuclease R